MATWFDDAARGVAKEEVGAIARMVDEIALEWRNEGLIVQAETAEDIAERIRAWYD